MTNTGSDACPLCGRVLKWSNASLNKLEGKRICGSCSEKLSKAFPGRFSFKDISIAQAKEQIQAYSENMQNYTPAPQEPKPVKVPKKAQCPKCHSTDIEPIGQKQKSFSVGKAAVGSVVFTPAIGLLTGMMGGKSKKVKFYCRNCGKIFSR